jgi:hypothetical protein
MYGTAECHGAASGLVAHHVLMPRNLSEESSQLFSEH